MKRKVRFIVIDDDSINNTICKITIETALGEIDIQTFTDPEVAFEYIQSGLSKGFGDGLSIMLLDLNMPTMSGWEFLEKFDNLNSGIKSHVRIYILSSSVDDRDRERSYSNKNVTDFLVKPLILDTVFKIVGQAQN